jgi:hypothetical protein
MRREPIVLLFKNRIEPTNHPGDVYLRRYGWRIHARPRRGPALWEKDGMVLTATEALEDIRARYKRLEESCSGT